MMLRSPCQALLLDLDGVLRRFDPAHAARVEATYELPDGLLARTLFDPDRLRPAVLGQVSHAGWTDGAITALAAQIGDPDRARGAVEEWNGYRGEVDDEVLAAVRELRATGIPVALTTNATDLLDSDLRQLGLVGEVDVVVNSAVLGHAKPSGEFFRAACDLLGVPAKLCLCCDDSERHVRGARAAGLAAIRYTGPADLRYVRATLAAAA